ncbi:unnamed protein product [Coffea canephora]|uniref:Uncharacterized protein n=1 Tax=Coffea canephora TaxID=49390 RepID=A0A068U5C4_COFCA|nr:unnamed protein product [Coffea canephora]
MYVFCGDMQYTSVIGEFFFFIDFISLDVYIHDYLVKRKYGNSARTFQTEAKIPTKPAAIDTPGGFLSEWWSVFWDIFIARYRWSGPNNEVLDRFIANV